MRPQNIAEQILWLLGVYQACGMIRRTRHATPEREKHGKKAGAYGHGLRNWITKKNRAALKARHV